MCPLSTSRLAVLHSLLPDLTFITPDSPDYAKAIDRWFYLSILPAAAIIYPTSPSSISQILTFCTENSIPIAVKGGGHGIRAASSSDGGLVIDLSKINSVVVDQHTRKIAVGGGALWQDVGAQAEKYGLAAVGGISPAVGVGGLALHGGYGWLTGAHGLAMDSILEIEVVLSDGSVVRASANENAELFWAMRGAGGCFGVVTEFVLRAYEQRNEVWTGYLVFERSALGTVTEVCNKVLDRTNEGKAALLFMWGSSPDGMLLTVIPWYNGGESEGKDFFAPLLALSPKVSKLQMVPFSRSGLESGSPPGKWRKASLGSSIMTPMSARFLEDRLNDFEAFIEKVPDAAKSIMGFEVHNTVPIISRGQQETAFPNRGNHSNVLIVPTWSNEENDVACKELSMEMNRKFGEELARRQKDTDVDEVSKFSVGIYSNYDSFGLSPKRLFGVNYERLLELKRRYDPQNVFRQGVDLFAD